MSSIAHGGLRRTTISSGAAVLAFTALAIVGCGTQDRVIAPTADPAAAQIDGGALPAGVVTVASVTELPALSGMEDLSTTALDISEQGIIVGVSGEHAVVWSSATASPVDLGEGQARAITRGGSTIVGSKHVVTWEAALWQNTGGGWSYTPLARPASPLTLGCSANDVSDDGTIVVGGCSSTTASLVVVWRGGTPTVLSSAAAGALPSAEAVNNRGEIVGTYNDQAVTWDADGTRTVIAGTELLTDAAAEDINAAGVIAVWASYHGYTSSNKGLEQLTAPTGFEFYRPQAINNKGYIVGYSGRDLVHPVLWTKSQVLDLGIPSGRYDARANGVNNKGDIVGEATVGTSYGGPSVAVLWTLK